MSGGKPGVFLDRDGVLNEVRMDGETASTPRTVQELHIYPDARRELERLRDAGFVLIVVSNQPDIARGDLTVGAVEEINAELTRLLPLDGVSYCPHDSRDGCVCRKPKPGLVLAAADRWGVDLSRSSLIGDRWVDIAAAASAGIDGILLRRPWSWDATSQGRPPPDLVPTASFDTLAGCVDFVLSAWFAG